MNWWLIPVLFIVALSLEILVLKLLIMFRPIRKKSKDNTDSQNKCSPTSKDPGISDGTNRDKMPSLVKRESYCHDNHSSDNHNCPSSSTKHK